MEKIISGLLAIVLAPILVLVMFLVIIFLLVRCIFVEDCIDDRVTDDQIREANERLRLR